MAVETGAAISEGLRNAGVPDQARRVVQFCLRTAERLIREYPEEPAYQVRLSEAWSQAGKAN